MPYDKIAGWKEVGGVQVPVDSDGHFLDWEDVREDEARRLTDPYGCMEWAVGGSNKSGDYTVFFDFALLPGDQIVIYSVQDSESGGFIEDFPGGGYEVMNRKEAPLHAFGLVDSAIEAVVENGFRHDTRGWNQTPWYFVYAVAHACGVPGYVPRKGKIPDYDVLKRFAEQ